MVMLDVQIIPEEWGRLADALEQGAELFGADIREGLRDAANEIAQEIDRRAPARMLKGRTIVEVDELHDVPEWAIVTMNHPMAHLYEHGTGIWGPRHRVIVPNQRNARLRSALAAQEGRANRPRVLRLRIGGVWLFRPQVRGMRPQPFFHPAVRASAPNVRERLSQILRRLEARWRGR